MPTIVAAFYQFEPIANPQAARVALHALAMQLNLKGTVIVAAEGINATVVGEALGIEAFLAALRSGGVEMPPMTRLELKQAPSKVMPFGRLKVKCKREIVTITAPEANPAQQVGVYVEPQDWNALLDDPDVVLVDTRNDFEVAIGSFDGAIDPGTANFSAFPEFVEQVLEPARNRKVAMFCTGGIRCEKATSLLLARGFQQVFHLKGGILNYLAKISPAENRWRGACFVFDDRETISATC